MMNRPIVYAVSITAILVLVAKHLYQDLDKLITAAIEDIPWEWR